MPAAMARQKPNLPPGQMSPDQHVRWIAKRRLNQSLFRFLKSSKLIKPTSSNDSYSRVHRQTLAASVWPSILIMLESLACCFSILIDWPYQYFKAFAI
jgi:hypothetical protein